MPRGPSNRAVPGAYPRSDGYLAATLVHAADTPARDENAPSWTTERLLPIRPRAARRTGRRESLKLALRGDRPGLTAKWGWKCRPQQDEIAVRAVVGEIDALPLNRFNPLPYGAGSSDEAGKG